MMFTSRFNREQIAQIRQVITDRNKEIRHEVSDHIDNALPVKKLEKGFAGDALVVSEAGDLVWEPQSGKRLVGGLSETVGDYGASILTGARTATLETVTVDGRSSAAKVRLKLQFPIVSWSVAGPCYFEIWDGTPGSGTLLYQGLYTMETANGYVPWYTEIDVAAFTGSKTFNVTIQNVIGATATITVFGAGGSRPRRFEAVWQT
jgi:hypothetical protein